jgi:predicted lipoprotein with Yx(FWY)xxD motif
MRFKIARAPLIAMAGIAAYLSVALLFSSSASAQSISCNDPVTAPTGPATVSAASTPFGKVLVVGSGAYDGCSLYLLTSDQLHSLAGAAFACGDNPTVLGPACDTVLWPALLTDGAPIAGPGVNPTLLGTVTRTDVLAGVSVHQVTYAGLPLYRFHFDEVPKETEGANVFDPVTSPTGIWYRVNASRGGPAPGQAQLELETARAPGVGPETVLAATMDDDFTTVSADGVAFPVYTLSSDSGHESACQELCAFDWPPVLTSQRPEAGPGVDQHALGIIVRPDGTHQVTYDGQPLYLFSNDAYIPGRFGTPGINGAGAQGPSEGIFNTIPPLP